MFRHYRVILRDLVIKTLPSYTSISNAAVGNTIYNSDFNILLSQMAAFVFSNFNLLIVNYITNSCIWNTRVTWQGTDYTLPEDDTIVSKHLGEW
jgi:hypothetical protein